MQEILKTISGVVMEYEGGAGVTKDELMRMQRSLSTNMYWLTLHNDEAFKKWNNLKYNFAGSNAGAETFANEEVPELRMTRKILEASKNVSISLTNDISIIKSE